MVLEVYYGQKKASGPSEVSRMKVLKLFGGNDQFCEEFPDMYQIL
jgi:hypothetical protein